MALSKYGTPSLESVDEAMKRVLTTVPWKDGESPMIPARESNGIELRLFTRYEHGNKPVRIFQDGNHTKYEVVESNEIRVYSSVRQLIAAQYGRTVSMTFDQYFRIGKHRRLGRPSTSNLLRLFDETPLLNTGPDLWADTPKSETPSLRSRETTKVGFSKSETPSLRSRETTKVGFSKSETPSLESLEVDLFLMELEEATKGVRRECVAIPKVMEGELERLLDRVQGLVGIDLGSAARVGGAKTRADEVRRLLWSGFAGKMLSQGYDPDDVLQEVFRGLLVRDKGKCPWDARKSTFGHYVHMVISCVLTNYHRKMGRRLDQPGLSKDVGEMELARGVVGLRESAGELGDLLAYRELENYVSSLVKDSDGELGMSILPLVVGGYRRAEIVKEIGKPAGMVARALAWVKGVAAEWAREEGLRV